MQKIDGSPLIHLNVNGSAPIAPHDASHDACAQPHMMHALSPCLCRPAIAGGAGTACMEQLRSKVELHLTTRHAAEKILRCWGSGAGLNYQVRAPR